MCGIVGYIGNGDAVAVLMDGLKRLEYRGDDSAGIAVIHHGRLEVRRSAGKVAARERVMSRTPAYVPRTSELLTPILCTMPLQLLAYHIAVVRDCDVDQPRDLAKSVTVG